MTYGTKAFARRLPALLLCGASATLLQACTTVAQEPTFRVRSDIAAPLNADAGWAGEPGESVAVIADRPFRLRMEIAPVQDATGYALQVRRNAGDWEMLEAQSFPYPQRELELSLADDAVGATPKGWSVVAGAASDLTVVGDLTDKILRARGGTPGLTAFYPAPWPLPEFGFAVRFRLPTDSSEGFDLLFGYVDADNHGRVRFDPAGGIAVVQMANGRETIVAQAAVTIARGAWHDAEIQFEDGTLAVDFGDGAFEFATLLEGTTAGNLGIAIPANGSVDLAEMTIEGVARTPGASIVATGAYANGDATSDLLSGSAAPFVPAFGISLDERIPSWDGRGRHGEFEWPLVIRRISDGPHVNNAGDIFEFRIADHQGNAASGGAVAQVSLAVPNGHLGGTFVETPGRIGPWQASNGDLYFIMEPSETDNKFMMMKSIDGGRSWLEVDGANRPQTGDLESVDGRLVADRIHIIHQVTQSVRYHVFNTSDHPTRPDSWGIRDEVAVEAEAIAQTASMAVRSDGSIVTFYLSDRLHFAIRGAAGTWQAPIEIDPEAGFINTGPQAVVGSNNTVHLAYFSDDGGIWYRRMLPDGTMTERQRLAQGAGTSRSEYGAVLPLAYDAASDTVFMVYRLADGTLWERRVLGGVNLTEPSLVSSSKVITNAVDSQQPAADLVHAGGTAYVLFVDEETRSIYSSKLQDGVWQEPTLRVGDIAGSWVRGNILQTAAGNRVYGFVFDAGSQGGTGLNRYAEFAIEAD